MGAGNLLIAATIFSVVCHATDGPNKISPPRTIYGNFLAVDGPSGPFMATVDGPPGPSTVP